MTQLIIKQEAIIEILKREIPKLFTEEAHKRFDFEHIELVPKWSYGETNHDVEEIIIEIKQLEQGPF